MTRCTVKLPLRFRDAERSASLVVDVRGRSSGEVSRERVFTTDEVADPDARTVTRALTPTGGAGGDVAPFATRCLNGEGARGGADTLESVEGVLEITEGELGIVLFREPDTDVVTFARGRRGAEDTVEDGLAGEGDRTPLAVPRMFETFAMILGALNDASDNELKRTDLWSLRRVHGR